MKSLTKTLGIAALGLSTLVSPVRAEEAKEQPLIHDAYVMSGWNSKYLGSYGFSATKTPVIQSDIGFSVGKFNFDSWSNYDLSREKLTEVDNTLSLSLKAGKYSITPSVVHFYSPIGDFGDAIEAGVRISRTDLPVNLSFFAANISGIGVKPGQAFDFQASKTLKLTERLSFNAQADLWVNNNYWCRGSGFSHVGLKGSINYNLGKGFSTSAYLKGQKAINDHGGTFKDNSAFGLSLTKNF